MECFRHGKWNALCHALRHGNGNASGMVVTMHSPWQCLRHGSNNALCHGNASWIPKEIESCSQIGPR